MVMPRLTRIMARSQRRIVPCAPPG
jgi:hypothetical protein